MTRAEAVQAVKDAAYLHERYPDALQQALETALEGTHEVEAKEVLQFALVRVLQALTAITDIDRTIERKTAERARVLASLPLSLLDKRYKAASKSDKTPEQAAFVEYLRHLHRNK
jgi:hypothetical protein